MLCHFESVSFGDGTPVCSGISLQCTEPVETEYTIKFVADVSSVITVAEIEEYLTTIIVGAKLTTGYDVDYISGSGKLSGDKFTGKFKEPVAGAVGEFACASFTGQTFPPGDYACFISGIYTSEGVGCKNLTLCHSSGPQNTTYTLKFNQAVTQTALGSELTTLVTTMNAAQSFYTYSLVGVSVDQEDKRTVALTVSESEANTFGGLFCRSAPQM